MGSEKRTGSSRTGDSAGRAARQPWSPEVRQRVVRAVVEQGLPVQRVARAVGVPDTTASEWVRRYRRGGPAALEPRSTGPAPRPARSDPRRDAVLALRREHPEFGVRRLRDVVRRWAALAVSATTVRRWLAAERPRPPRPPRPAPKPRPPARRFERAEPNQLWQSDLFTFRLRRHERVYVAAFLDDHSRYVVACVLAHHQRASLVLEALARGIADYGVPREMLTDQGRQYTAWRGTTEFEEELRRHGIRHVKSRPHHPQTLGKIERFWKTLWEEFLARTVFADFADCERRVALFLQHYNFQRPHQALGGLVPADRFFRAASPVRAAIEQQVAANALRLAQQQPPREPFYLAGQLGDQAVSIAASGSRLKIHVGTHEHAIPLPKEDDDDALETMRPRPARPAESAPAAVAAAGADLTSDRLGSLPAAPAGPLGGGAREPGHRDGEDLAADLLLARAEGAAGDAGGADAGGAAGAPAPRLRSDGAADPAGGESARPRAGEAPGGAAADGDPGGAAAGAAPALELEWATRFARLGDGEDPPPTPFDPGRGGAADRADARKLVRQARLEEAADGDSDEPVHTPPDGAGEGSRPDAGAPRGAPGAVDADASGAGAEALAPAGADAAASGAHGLPRGADPEAGGPAATTRTGGETPGGECPPAPGGRTLAAARADDGPAPGGRQWAPQGPGPDARPGDADGAESAPPGAP